MQIVRYAEATPYEAPGHRGVRSFRIQGGGASSGSVGVSTYEPGGCAEMDVSAIEKIYVVLSGEFTLTLSTGERSVLQALDSCLIEPGDRRELVNSSGGEARLLVVTPGGPRSGSKP